MQQIDVVMARRTAARVSRFPLTGFGVRFERTTSFGGSIEESRDGFRWLLASRRFSSGLRMISANQSNPASCHPPYKIFSLTLKDMIMSTTVSFVLALAWAIVEIRGREIARRKVTNASPFTLDDCNSLVKPLHECLSIHSGDIS